ncbi:hypothetical protein WICPIJ_004566 [Wickerhamomyces pijperi]|uniref:C2H2-type domain-containing protein n=1 Tax=Wickerhamomyces pijperi TaxID=599730 RepID=A0A9P8Q5R1_WICPI|nr:hypothetical protein WICPIJ_004566 [Wickerhamomyces pijperi]
MTTKDALQHLQTAEVAEGVQLTSDKQQPSPTSPVKKPKQVQQSVQGFEPIPRKSAIIKTDKPRPHICTTCTRAFARLEHLKRHERSHTNEKPFQCAACGRCFARRDLVLRHQQKLHTGLNINGTEEKLNPNDLVILNYGNKEGQLPTKTQSPESVSQQSSSSIPQKNKLDTSNSTVNTDPSSSLFQGQPHVKRQRHNSFSASSSNSYTKSQLNNCATADSSGQQINADSVHELPEAPHQVGFATPQLTARELNERAVMSGLDLDVLGITEPDDFSLDPNVNNAGDYFSQQHKPIVNSGGGNGNSRSKSSTPFQFAITPGGSLADMPMMNEYLHVGGAGGGAGFNPTRNVVNLNFFQHESASLSPVGYQVNSNGTNTDDPTSVTSIRDEDDNSTQDDWLGEFINTPFESNFVPNVKNLNSIGFTNSISPASSTNSVKFNPTQAAATTTNDIQPPFNATPSHFLQQSQLPTGFTPKLQSQSNIEYAPGSKLARGAALQNDIPSLFRSRQLDLFKKVIENRDIDFGVCLFSEELRLQIMKLNNLQDFPSVSELNQYASLYKDEFDKYFPFIHLASLKPSVDNYPLLLSLASIGALYAFHSSHAMLLFDITRFRIHEYLELQKTFKNNKSIPMWIYQAMVLLIFVGIFNNDLNVNKNSTVLLHSLIELVKLTSLNLPLETFVPPPDVNVSGNAHFEYFLLAQSRIRTCHTILLISNLFTSLIGLDCSLHSLDLKCGIHCKWEELWTAATTEEWFKVLEGKNYKIDSKFNLVELSNGNDSYNNLLSYLTLNNYHLTIHDDLPISFNDSSVPTYKRKFQMKTLLSLLMSIHEKIYLERSMHKNEKNPKVLATKWRMNSRPIIESLIKSFESLYLKNGGVFYHNEASLPLIFDKNPIMRLILPLLSFAKIRKCISLTPIIEKIWRKDWAGMNDNLNNLGGRVDEEALKDSTNYSLDIVKLWIDYVSIHNDAEKTSIRTPVFFITCIFSSLLIIAEFLFSVEQFAYKYRANPNEYMDLNAIDRTIWLRSEMIFKKIENCLLASSPVPSSTPSENLRQEANGALDFINITDEIAKFAMNPSTDLTETCNIIINAKLSTKALYLGVRLLADAPIWPIALLFAQGLKARAMYISDSQDKII